MLKEKKNQEIKLCFSQVIKNPPPRILSGFAVVKKCYLNNKITNRHKLVTLINSSFKSHVENHSSNNMESASSLHTDEEENIPESSAIKELHAGKHN